MLQKAGVVVKLRQLDLVGKSQCHIDAHLILRLVRPVTPLFLALPVLDGGHSLVSHDLLHIVGNAVFVPEFPDRKAAVLTLAPVGKQQVRIDDCLPPENIVEKLVRDPDIREYIQIRLPPGSGTGFFLGGGFFLQSAHIIAVLKMQVVPETIPEDFHIHKF